MTPEAPDDTASKPAAGYPPSTSPVTDRALWPEVVAVLAVGVFPNLMYAINRLFLGTQLKFPYWLDALDLCVRSACVSFAVLFVMHRGGEAWAAFGLKRVQAGDCGSDY